MNELEDFLVRNMTLFSAIGLALRFVIYGMPSLDLVWLWLVLAFAIGNGGALLAVAKTYERPRFYIYGIILVIIGFLPLQLLFG
ncbi:MAG: hypothetical protein P1Q69_13140 [Candidatus Thorarchaeota archaeon]|nr:hypothetical protein [Candidatus Thorarchaeota archaeon]